MRRARLLVRVVGALLVAATMVTSVGVGAASAQVADDSVTISGTVRTSRGELARGAWVSVSRLDGTGSSGSRVDADGRYSVVVSGRDATFLMQVSPSSGNAAFDDQPDPFSQPAYREVTGDGTAAITQDVTLAAGGAIRGAITSDGALATNPHLTLTPVQDPSSPIVVQPSLSFDDQSEWQFRGVAPGEYIVTIDVYAHWPADYDPDGDGVPNPITVRPDEWTDIADVDLEKIPSAVDPVAPARLVDTRVGRPQGLVHVTKGKVLPATPRTVKVAGVAGIGDVGEVGAVTLNVTAVGATGGGYVTVYPCGQRPVVSSLNYANADPVANSVTAPVSAQGTICLYSNTPADLIVDVSGWSPAEGVFERVGPSRVVDTRAGRPQGLVPVTKSQVRPGVAGAKKFSLASVLDLSGRQGSMAVLNVTATGSRSGGYVSVYRCTEPFAELSTSTVNFAAGQTVANATVVSVSTFSDICVSSNVAVDVIVDISGVYREGSVSELAFRVADTRPGRPAFSDVERRKVGGSHVLEATVAAPVPGAAFLNLTVTGSSAEGFATVYPCDQSRPGTSSVNFRAGQTVANHVVSPLTTGTGTVCVYASTPVDVIIDTMGWTSW